MLKGVIILTQREREILEIIKGNPLISQQEIGQALGITRSSVAVHIANLIKKGYIKGKGYIVSEEDYVTVIGGANIDIHGLPNQELKLKDSNPGAVRISLGGVARNIAENLVKLKISTNLITALGNDIYGNIIKNNCTTIGINIENSLILENKSTSVYLSLLNHEGDMEAAISHMDILDDLSLDFIKEKSGIINNSRIIILDTNLRQDTIEYITSSFKGKDIFVDTVSTSKAIKLKESIRDIHTIKPNKLEAEALTGIPIYDEAGIWENINYFLRKGVKRVFLTLGKDGVYYGDQENKGLIKVPKVKVKNTTGAGDAFFAGLVYGYLNEFDIHKIAKFAVGASIMALSREETINPDISVENIERLVKELRI